MQHWLKVYSPVLHRRRRVGGEPALECALASSIPIWPCGVVVAVAYLLEDAALARSCSSGKRSVDEVNPSLGRLVRSREENACIIPLQEVKGSAQDQYRIGG